MGFRYQYKNRSSSPNFCADTSSTFSTKNFRIKSIEKIDIYLLVKIHYNECKNFEGNKILLFKNLSIEELLSMNDIDPHFSNKNGNKSPIARFEPID